MEKVTLNINECAEFLKIKRTFALELAGSGKLPGAKIGRTWVFLQNDLVEYLRSEASRQQSERQDKERLANEFILATYSPRRQPKNRRRPLPKLPEID